MNNRNVMRRRSKSVSDLSKLRTPLIPIPVNRLKRTGINTSEAPAAKTQKVAPQTQQRLRPLPSTSTNRVPLTGPGATRGGLLTKISENKTNRPAAPSKAALSKPAPYDYKARWQLLNEKFTILKAEHDKQSKEYQQFVDENAELVNIREQYETASVSLKSLEEKNVVLEARKSELEANLNTCTAELSTCKTTLSTVTNRLNTLEQENALLKIRQTEVETKLTTSEAQVQILSDRLFQSDTERRKLHNQVQDLKGNIRVFCRIRPMLKHEEEKTEINVNYLDEATLEVHDPTQKTTTKQEFSFDRVFSPSASQELVFDELGQLVESALDGYNVCVFAYGQTGSGKTYTMEGNRQSQNAGMIPRTAELIFKSIENRRLIDWDFNVSVSFLEIYNEHIIDLLNNSDKKETYEIRMVDPKGTDLYVTNLKIEKITSSEQLLVKLALAQNNRAVAATTMNAHSSRSHCVGKIYLTGINQRTKEKCTSSLSLVDLAGSERLHDTKDQARLTETKNINKSLANLGNVILALSQKNKHVPYRNSKLTHLLMPSLGGNSKMLMFVNVSPLLESYNETLNSLRFASKVNCTKIGKTKKNKVQNLEF